MTNNQYNKLLLRLSKANEKYKKLLDEAENEFKRRYGAFPSDIDFDSWIDVYHVATGFFSAEKIDKEFNEL